MTERSWVSGEQHTITALLDRRLADDPDSQYLDVCGATFTAAEVNTTASKLANALRELGVRPGDRVANLIENSPEALLSWWGAIRGGSIAVPINTAYKGQYLRHQLGDSGARVVIVQRTLADRIGAVLDDLPELEHVIIVDDREEPGVGQEIAPTAKVAVHEWDELLAVDATTPEVAVRPSDLATFIYTGGTTGPSKGCMLSHNYHEALSRQIGICWGRTADDVVWTPLPLFHYNALVTAVLGSLVFGGRGAIYRRFSVSNFWPEMNRVGATITSTLGTMAYLLANDTDRPEMPKSGAPEANTSLRLLGAAPLPAEVDNQLRERFGVETFSGAFGLTEASLVSWQPPGVRNKPNAAGVLNDEYFDVRLFDDDEKEVPQGERGEIVVRPKRPHVMFEGYWGRPDATVERDPQPLVPHRRHRPPRRGRLPVLRRPQGRLPPPPRREHLELRGGERAHGARRARRRRGVRGAERDDRGRPQDHRDPEGRCVDHRGGAVPVVHRPAPVLRAAALRRVPQRTAAQPGRPRARSATCATRA